MRNLIITLAVCTIVFTLGTALLTASHQTTVIVGCVCICISIIVSIMAKRSFKSTKGMEDL